MAQTAYAGIDYSLGQSNVSRKTGIHYGVISQHSISLGAWSDAEPIYPDPTCPKCGAPVIEPSDPSIEDAEWNNGKDYACSECEQTYWSEECYPEEPIGYEYDSDGYKLTDCIDSDIFVLDSPYYTFAQFCSPCVPGAGNLDNPCDDGPKTYCLGHEWFDEGRASYTVYRVSNDEVVEPS